MANYLKLLLLSLLIVSLMSVTWAVTMGCGPFYGIRLINSMGGNLIFGLLILLASGLGYFFTKNGNVKSLLCGMAFGSLCGTFTTLCVWFGDIIAESNGGFWLGVLYWFVCMIGVAACGAALVFAAKTAIFSILRLDFFMVLICIIIGVSVFFAGMSLFVNAFQYHTLVGIGIIVGLVGGGAAGFGAPAADSPVVMGGDGNMHFIASKIGNNEIIDTDGNRMRQMPDGTYRTFSE